MKMKIHLKNKSFEFEQIKNKVIYWFLI